MAARNASSVALFVRCGILGLALNLVGWAHTCRADEFDVLREKWVEMLTGGSHLDLHGSRRYFLHQQPQLFGEFLLVDDG